MNILVLLLIRQCSVYLTVLYFLFIFICLYIYIYIYTHTHTHTHTPFFYFILFYFILFRSIEHNPYNTCTVIVTVHNLYEKKSGQMILKPLAVRQSGSLSVRQVI